MCGKVVPIVNGLAKEYEGQMQFAVEDGTTDANLARIEKYGLEVHGMVITDKDDKVIWSESSHNQKRDKVKAAIDKALGS